MGLFRVLQFPAEDSYNGQYMCRVPVVDAETYHGVSQTLIAAGQANSIEEVIQNLDYYGVGDNFISLFTDLRYNNEPIGDPPNYDCQFMLHQIFPSVSSALFPDAETTVSNTIKVFNRTVGLPIKATHGASSTGFYTHKTDTSNLLRHEIEITYDAQYFYYFHIVLGGVYTDQLNGNKFDFSGSNQDCPIIDIGVTRDSEDTWFWQAWVYGGVWPIGLDIKNSLDGQETDDAEQDSDDPYDDGGDSGGGGGGGNFDDSSDDVDFPDLPTISATDTGFITLFVPSITQLQNLATYMWTDPTFDLEFWRKIMADPMDAILGLSIVPYAVPSAGAVNVTVGNIATNVTMNKASAQFFALDCGTVTLDEYFGSYLDYEPYTSIDIYLPFIGIRKLSTDDLMPKSVHVKYHIDILTGSCVAMIKCSKDGHGGVMYTYQGNCATEIPVTSIGFGNTVRSAISFGTSAATLISTGGAAAPASIGGMANSVMNAKPTITKSNNIGASGGLMANKTPYLIIHRANQCKPANQNKYLGYPAFITESVSGLSGYTSFEAIRLNNIKCNDDEMNEIMQLLKEGVIL